MISVIIPTHSSPDALDLCLKSCIEGQTQKNEIIVIVDGFYDINKDVLEKWSVHIDVLNMEENVGLCRGTNLGVYNAKYERIKQENLIKIGIINLAFFQSLEWNSIKEASIELNINSGSISNCINMKRQKTAGGFIWKIKE
jgi:glycosyltransferase involved in cell wall biosynthesis